MGDLAWGGRMALLAPRRRLGTLWLRRSRWRRPGRERRGVDAQLLEGNRRALEAEARVGALGRKVEPQPATKRLEDAFAVADVDQDRVAARGARLDFHRRAGVDPVDHRHGGVLGE